MSRYSRVSQSRNAAHSRSSVTSNESGNAHAGKPCAHTHKKKRSDPRPLYTSEDMVCANKYIGSSPDQIAKRGRVDVATERTKEQRTDFRRQRVHVAQHCYQFGIFNCKCHLSLRHTKCQKPRSHARTVRVRSLFEARCAASRTHICHCCRTR